MSSCQRPGCSALHMPKPTPMMTPITMAKKASSRVTGSAVPINVLTGSRETSEMPRLPVSSECSHDQYCWKAG